MIDAPGHRDFIKNMITGASQADVGLLLVPADGNFGSAIAKGNHKAGEVQGQTRQHAALLNLLGVKQLVIGVNKMDDGIAGYGEARFNEVRDNMIDMLKKVGWKKDVIARTPILPMSGWIGDNITTKTANMPWWTGLDVDSIDGSSAHVDTLLDCLEFWAKPPVRDAAAPMRAPVSGVFNKRGVGDVITTRVEQGVIKPGDRCKFLPTHTDKVPCHGKVFSIEMHHKSVDHASAGDNVGMNFRGLTRENMPRVGDIMVLESDDSITRTVRFQCQVQVLQHPGELKVGYTPIGCVRTARAPCRLAKIVWKAGKATGGTKVEDPDFLKAGEMALCEFEPQNPLVVDDFKVCEGLGRVAFLEGNGVVMLGKVNASNPTSS